jgi:hypothetical protein
MYGSGAARRILYCDQQTFLTRKVGQIFRNDAYAENWLGPGKFGHVAHSTDSDDKGFVRERANERLLRAAGVTSRFGRKRGRMDPT